MSERTAWTLTGVALMLMGLAEVALSLTRQQTLLVNILVGIILIIGGVFSLSQRK